MNFETLKLGFKNYLEELNETSNKSYTVTGSDISIFMYANEFKNYISDELNCDTSIFSKSVNEILDMEIINGQLVDLQEQIGLNQGNNSDETNINVEESNSDNQLLNSDNTQNSTESNGENTNQNLFTDIMNDLFQDADFKKSIDTDGDDNLSEDEITAFFNTIKGYDSNESNVSLDDIMQAVENISNGEFQITTPETIEESINTETPLTPKGAEAAANRSAGGSGNAVSSSGSSNPQTQETKEKTLENMNKEELNSELKTAESDLSEKQDALSSILDGSDSAINKLKEAEDKAFDSLQGELELVDEDMADQLNTLKQQIDDKQKEIDEQDQLIADQETAVSDAENSYNNAVSSRENLESILDSLNAAKTSDMDSEQASSIESQITEVESQIETAKENEEKAKEAWDKAKEDLETLNTEREKLVSDEGGLDDLNEQLATLESDISLKYPELQEFIDNYDKAKKDYTEGKENAVKTAKADIKTAQDRVNEVKTAITNYDNKTAEREYSPDGLTNLTKTAIELAYSQLGIYEDAGDNRGTMEKYGAGAGQPWCAAFVSWIYGKGQNGENNNPLSFTASVSNLRDQAKSAGYYSEVGSYTPVPGDIMIQKSNGASHTGIVVGVEGNTIYTIEGNSGDAVRERKYTVGSSGYNKISGWIRMNEWSGGSSNISTTTYLSQVNNSEDSSKIKRSTT